MVFFGATMGPAAALLLSLSTLCYCWPCRWDGPAVLDCTGAGLSALPGRLPPRVAVLDLGRHALRGVAQLRLGGNMIRRLSLCLGGAGGPEPARPLTPDTPRRSGERLCVSWAPDLQLLSVERNQLRHIPAGLGRSPSLRVLQLSGNKISAIRQQDLRNCTELRAVFLQHNEVSAIDPSAFRDLGQLQVLDLSYNALTTIPASACVSLTLPGLRVDLRNNSWLCDCGLLAVKRCLASIRGASQQSWPLVCEEPAGLAGRDLLTLGESELSCKRPGGEPGPPRAVTTRTGRHTVLPCGISDQDAGLKYWLTPHGQVWETHTGRLQLREDGGLAIRGVQEGDAGPYVCAAGGKLGSVFILDVHAQSHGPVRPARTARDTRASPRKQIGHSDFVLAVCLSVFITFICAFFIGVAARPLLDLFWHKIHRRKRSSAEHTYKNEGFSEGGADAERTENASVGEMRNPTWSRAANDNYVTILQAPPSAESRQDCVSENGSSTSSQSSVVRDQTLTGAESKNREVDQNIFVSVPPWYPHCLSDTHQHFRGEDNQGLTLPPCHEGQDVSGHLTSRPEEETAPSTDHLKGDLEAKNAILGPGFNQQPSNLNEVKDLQQPEGYSHSMEEDGNVGHQEPSRLLPSSAVSETGSAWVKNTGDIEEDLAVREKDVNSTVWEPFPFRDHSASFEGQLDRSQVLVHDSQAPAATRREGAEWTSQQAPAEERDAVNFYYSSGLVAEQKTSASSSAGSAQSEPGDLQKAELLSGGTPTGRSDSCCLDPWTAPSRDAEQFGRSDQMSNILDTHKETDHKTLKGFPELTEGILRQLSPEFDSEFWNDSGESFEFSDSNVEDNMNATLFSDFNLAQQLKMERWSPFGGPTPNEPREDESNSEVQNGSFNSSPDLSRHCPERTKFSEKQPAANLQVIDNREWGNRITSNTCENADYDGNLNSSPTFNLDSESTLHLEKCCTGAFSTQHTTVPHGGDFLCPDSPSFKDMEEDAENAKTEEARESDQHGHLALDRTKSSMEEHEAAGWTVFNCNPTLQSFSGETGEMTEWPPAPTEAGADDFHAASPPGGTPQNASPQSTRSPPSEMWSDLILPDEMFATRPRHLESEVAETDSSLSQDSSGSSATLVNSEGIPTTEEDFSESPRPATGPGEDEQVNTQLLRHQEPVEAWLSAPAGERRETVQSFSHCKQKLDWTKGGYFVQKRKIMDTFSAGFYSSVSKTTEASRKGCEEENTPSAAHASRIRSESSGAPMSGSTVTFSAGQLQGEPAYISPREITETEKPLGASSPKACERGWGGSRGPEGPLLALPTSSPEEQPGSPAAPLFLSEARSNEGSEA